jgi:hypothetical protein
MLLQCFIALKMALIPTLRIALRCLPYYIQDGSILRSEAVRDVACHFTVLQAYAGTHAALADQDIESEEGWRSTSKFNHQKSPK